VETTPIIVERNFALVAASEGLQNYDNLVGEIDTAPLMAIKDFIGKSSIFVLILKIVIFQIGSV
jgi:hypothetical protein